MATWVIDVNNGEYQFPVASRWAISDRAELKENGETDYIETVLNVEVELVPSVGSADPAEEVTTAFQLLRSVMIDDTAPKRIRLMKDAVVEYDFQPSEGIGTPKCRDLVQITTGGDHATHVRAQLSIYHKREGSAGGVFDLSREVSEEAYGGLLIRKRWYVRARAKTIEKARAACVKYKPSPKPLYEMARELIEQNGYEIEWIWERAADLKNGTVVQETVEFLPAGQGLTPDPVVGATPFYHRRRSSAGYVRVSVTVQSQSRDAVIAPTPHLADSDTVKRDRTQETGGHPVICVDRVKGIFQAVFVEFYWVSNNTFPQLNHSSHARAYPNPVIPNGPIGGTAGRIGTGR
jgi:hypothetical protein